MRETTDSAALKIILEMAGKDPGSKGYIEARLVPGVGDGSLGQLIDYADESDFSLKQWLEALQTLDVWLAARALEMSIRDQIGYISCAGEMAGAASNLTYLPELVIEMLETYGCERARPRGTDCSENGSE